jgi:predicted nuclease with RNAse H fold
VNIISVDLSWKSTTKGHRALAIVDLNKNIVIKTAENDDELLQLVQDNTEQKSIILLDIPIEGCGQIKVKKFRPIDKALARQGIWILPASGATDRGKSLKRRIQSTNQGKKIIVQEIYPYAIYKFLAYLESNGLLLCLSLGKFDILLGDGFRRFVPPKYKRDREKGKRVENMRYLYSLLTDSGIGLEFSPPLDCPDFSYTWNKLNSLADKYDACLGAIVGICWAEGSHYAWIAGGSKSGEMLLLADDWLKERLKKEIYR